VEGLKFGCRGDTATGGGFLIQFKKIGVIRKRISVIPEIKST
jgi:hypothetical protein